jgi:threonylcarbamoyladenosine tRNA methylthiotransferase MtaB
MRIALTTLGCKINQYETDILRKDLTSKGNTIVPFNSPADVYIINTCSVTAKSDTQCRQIIRAATRRSQGAKVIVTGCYAQTRPDEIRSIPGVDSVFGNDEKQNIIQYLNSQPIEMPEQTRVSVPIRSIKSRTRGFLKIQDGCNNFCSYCIVPYARGRSKSIDPRDLVLEFERLVKEHCPEIVLTGIHIGAYGVDLPEKGNLIELLVSLIKKREHSRIRLSSIEPREITDDIIGLMGKGLCRHLHIPLQSGDDGILHSMKRNYTAGYYRELVEKMARAVPGIALGADVMVGYPGEGDKEFNNTIRLIETAPITHLHVFSYSPRPGTAAAEMAGHLSETVKKERNEILRLIGQEKNLKFRQKHCGTELSVVVEDKVDAETGQISGLSDNYIKVQITDAKQKHIGEKINVRILEVNLNKTIAKIT